MTDLENILATSCAAIREKLSQANVFQFNLEIEISGRVDSCDPLAIEYRLGGYSDRVSGNDLKAVVIEYLRRKGWTEEHAYKALPAPVDLKKELDDEIPF